VFICDTCTRDTGYSVQHAWENGKWLQYLQCYDRKIFKNSVIWENQGADEKIVNPANGLERSRNIIVSCIQLARGRILRSYGNTS
jgi:hypothetical protein